MPLQTGEQVGDFVIISQIGQGAFGVVYKARDVGLRRLVAIKELVAHSPGLESTDYRSQHKRFEHEVETLSRFSHSNVVAAYQILHGAHADYLVMEYVGGDSLKKLLGTGRPLPVAQAVHIALELCRAIAEMARHSIVHRDIKPDNILLTPNGQVKLTDFGIAQLGTDSKRSQPSGSGRTHPGTPRYKSPEQENSSSYLDQRSDLYTLGLVLYEMLTGQAYKAVRQPVRQVNPDVPRSLELVLDKALQPDRDRRFQNAPEMEAALLRACPKSAGAPAKAASKSPAGKSNARLIYGLLGLGALAVIALGLILTSPGKSPPVVTGVLVSMSTVQPSTAVVVADGSNTPTPAASDFKYGSQLEIVGDSDARFQKDQAVTLEWKSPPGVTALAANEVYVVRVAYQDANGQSQTISLTAATTQIALPREKFFTNDQPVAAKDTPYQWTVAVAARLADQTFKEISPPTKPPYAFYWMANPPTALPRAATPREAQPGSTPAPTLATNGATPVCPSGQFYDDVMGRCKGIPGPGPDPVPVNPPPPVGG